MLKKMGLVTIGIAAGLVAAAPLASATECAHGPSHPQSGHPAPAGNNNTTCSATNNENPVSDIAGDSGATAVAQAPEGAAGQILSCNSFANDNFTNSNLTVPVSVLGEGMPVT